MRWRDVLGPIQCLRAAPPRADVSPASAQPGSLLAPAPAAAPTQPVHLGYAAPALAPRLESGLPRTS